MPTKTAPAPATVPVHSRAPIALPTIKVTETEEVLPDRSGATGTANPLLEPVKVAVANKGKVYLVENLATEQVANKVISLLQRAAKDTPCSIRAKYDADRKVVLFKAIDKITRKPATPSAS